ncbi:MAG: phosphoglycerate dehydrogenase [Cyclobacteriaceae bacterium]|nr:phosphoglycerate dehydrogenase [Cyclobacteriaceae bacterium]
MALKILIVDKMHPSILDLFKELGINPDYFPEMNREEIITKIASYEGLVIRSKTTVDRELIEAGQKLQFVARAGSGTDNLDADYLVKKGIRIFNAGEGNCDAVGDHTLGLLLSLLRNIVKSNDEIIHDKWLREENRGRELNNMTVGIIGFGHTGQAVVKRLLPFGCKVLVHDKYKFGFGNNFIEESTLENIKEKAHILSLHIPLTFETRHMVDDAFFASFHHNLYLINTSRGEIVDTEALVRNLKSGKVLGTALDVLEPEGKSFIKRRSENHLQSLLNHENAIVTPHIAGWTFESYKKINEVLIDKIKKEFIHNKP